MADEKQEYIAIDASAETRAGVHSDLVMVATKRNCTRLDFILTDGISGDSNDTTAVLSSRVFMDNADLIALRDMLNRHTASWKITREPDDAE